jgi:hypothetical protein
MILADVQREHGIPAADALIQDFDLENVFGIKPGTVLSTPGNK